MKTRNNLYRVLVVVLAIAIASSITGCSNWEKSTYQVLSGAHALTEQAAKDFNSGAIVGTPANYQLIDKAQKTKTAAAQAFMSYLQVKKVAQLKLQAGEISRSEADKRTEAAIAAVNQAMIELPDLISRLKAITKPVDKTSSALLDGK